ncbi:MAG: ferritin-like domain-containing protein [Deltaproteobacteria bacterium]|nr:ferritin-like domain-containing protein [Deltaproteobacteria bacterium]
MILLDLRAAGRATGVALSGIELADEERASAIEEWRGRMVNEHVSARVFAQLIPQMMRAGIEPTVQAKVADMVAQELRHGRLCAGVVEALGGTATASQPELADVPMHEDADPIEGVLRNVLAISCLEETVAVALLEVNRQLSGPQPIRAVVTEILRDEVNHSKLGWQLADELLPRVDLATRDRLSEYLVPAFRQLLLRHWIPDAIDLGARLAVPAIGVDDARAASRLSLDVIARVIVPGLEAHGLAAREALALAAA